MDGGMDKRTDEREWVSEWVLINTCIGLAAACRGLMTSCLPLVYSIWSESGLQDTEYTGMPLKQNKTK